MKAIVLRSFGGPEVLRIEEVPTPKPTADEVLIRIHATALNRADLSERRGHYPPPGPTPVYEIPGLECSGQVEEVGERVEHFRVGDRVMALLPAGGYAEYVKVPEGLLMAVPEGMDLLNAAAIPEVFLTAFDALYDKAEARPGQRLLVHAGASGVGSAAIQLAAQASMRVMTTVGSERKLEAARAFGADVAVNYRDQSFAEAVQRWSDGEGVRSILDFVGQAYLRDNLRSLSPGGTLVLIGTLSGAESSINLGMVLGKRLTIRGTALRSRPPEDKIRLVSRFRQEAWPLLASGAIKPVVDGVYPLDQIQEAHRYMEENRNIGKIVIRVPT